MKKSLFVLGVAVAALASCTQSEVLEVAEGRAIQFNTFVNNNTKAVSPLTDSNLKKFFVFGNYGDNTWTPVYTNVAVNGGAVGDNSVWKPELTAYWEPEQKYRFAAYSDGGTKFDDASFTPESQILTFTDYAVGNNDLVVAIPAEVTSAASDATNDAVNLSFYHMLSRVKFTFTNTDSYDYTMAISNITVNAVNKATGTYTYGTTNNTINWNTNTSTGNYAFGDLEDIAQAVSDDTHSVELFVIPQSNATLSVSFDATFSDAAGTIAEGSFTGSLSYSGSASSTTTEWVPGYMYNYQVTINGSTIDPDLEKQVIEFKVDEVKDWVSDGDATVTPQ